MPPIGEPEASVLASVSHQCVWLSGRSSRRNALLLPYQVKLMEVLRRHGFTPAMVGFPWTVAAASGQLEHVPLWLASLRNGWQFSAARWFAPRQRAIARQLQVALDRSHTHLVVVANSAGLQMLSSAWPFVRVPQVVTLTVVVFGPVGSVNPQLLADCRGGFTAVQGTQDWLSRFAYRGPVHHVIPGNHLTAVASPTAQVILVDAVVAGSSLPGGEAPHGA